MAIETMDLAKKFNGLVAVDRMNLKIAEGELFSLLGPNGAGKSTTMRMLSTLLLPTSGTAKIMGRDVVKEPTEVKRMLGICPQETVLYDYLTGEENLRFFGTLQGMSGAQLTARVDEILELVQLTDARKRRFKTYSGGMKHRLNLAVALLHDPEVLILDEPTTGLDPQGRRAVWDMIQGFKARERTVLLSTHYMEEADFLSDRVGIMDHGKIIALDTPENLKDSLGGEEVIEIYSSLIPEETEKEMSTLPGVKKAIARPSVIDAEPSILKIFTEEADITVPRAVETASKRGMKIQKVEVTKPTLEDVFIRLTGRSLRE